MSKIPARIAYGLIIGLIAFSNVSIGEFGGIRMSAAVLFPLVAALVFILSAVKITESWLARSMFIMIWVLLSVGLNFTIAVDQEKFQMPALNLVANVFAVVMLHAVLRSRSVVSEYVLRGVQDGTLAAAILGLAQFIFANTVGALPEAFYPFGESTYELRDLDSLTKFAGFIRLQSVFYEPSIAGQMFILGIVVTKLIGNNSVLRSLTYWTALVLTFSVSALLSAVVLGAAYALTRRKAVAGAPARDWASLSAAFILTGALAAIAAFASEEYNILNRLHEIVTPGTSGYHRVITPILFISELLSNHPFGVGVGCIDEYIKTEWMRLDVIGLFYGSSASLITVDNVLIAWLAWFGYPALIPIGFFILSVARCLKSGWSEAICIITFLISVGNTTFFYVPLFFSVFLAIYSRCELVCQPLARRRLKSVGEKDRR